MHIGLWAAELGYASLHLRAEGVQLRTNHQDIRVVGSMSFIEGCL